MITFFKITAIICTLLMVIFIWAACIVSGRESRREEEMEMHKAQREQEIFS